MNVSISTVAALGCGLCGLAAAAPRLLAPIYIEADAMSDAMLHNERIAGPESLRDIDAASALTRMPGTAVVRNGPQTGIVQIRGLSGDRVGIRVDGMTITPACPNHMDPPLHYADLSEGSLIKLFAGIAPVSEGGDSIAGALSVSRSAPQFAADGGSDTHGSIGTSYLGSQDATRLSSNLTHALGDMVFRYNGSASNAQDLRFPGGRVRDSGYDMTRHGFSAAWRTAGGFLEVDGGFSATRDAGTPALPMDMVSDDAWNLGIRQSEEFAWGTLEQRLYLHDIEHLMDNYSNRPVSGMAMKAPSTSRDMGWQGGVLLERGDAKLRFGVDLHRNEFDAEQIAVSTGLRRDMFDDNVRSRYGTYADWEHEWSAASITRIGLRSDLVTSDAGTVSNQIMPMGPILADQNAFNAADRSIDEWLVDAVAAWRYATDERTTWELAFAVKNRAPSLVERYLWTPLSASAGLADGRTYLGNPGLDPETAYQVSLAYETRGEAWQMRVTPFYQSVSDFIQGMPIARNDSNGKPVLQFQNIDRAELYGCEWVGGYTFTPEWSIELMASYVRGRNQETGDDLYRIAPLHGIADLAYRKHAWELHLESQWAAAQNDVSETQGESSSPGYGIFNLRVARTFDASIRVEVGIENLLDKRYADHLGGVNRVTTSDLAVGESIPGAGRFAYIAVSKEF